MAAYPNTLGVVAANEVLLHAGHTAGAAVVRALVRDVKRYMALHAAANPEGQQRVLPVGVSSNGVSSIFYDEFRYYTGGDPAEAVDFFSVSDSYPLNSMFHFPDIDLLICLFRLVVE